MIHVRHAHVWYGLFGPDTVRPNDIIPSPAFGSALMRITGELLRTGERTHVWRVRQGVHLHAPSNFDVPRGFTKNWAAITPSETP